LTQSMMKHEGFFSILNAKMPSSLSIYVSWGRGLQQKLLRSKHRLLQTCCILPTKWL